MYTDFIPARQADFLAWSTNFNTRINASPTDFGLTAAQATAYTTLHDAFVAAYDIAMDPGTRTTEAILNKDDARKPLAAQARILARIIQAHPGITNGQRELLGLTIPDDIISPRPVPAFSPILEILSVVGRNMKIRLIDRENPARRGKPADVTGATVFSYVGETPPASLEDWKFEGNITRTRIEIAFGASVPAGAQIWLTAFWRNGRDVSGPACDPVGTNLGGGLAMAA